MVDFIFPSIDHTENAETSPEHPSRPGLFFQPGLGDDGDTRFQASGRAKGAEERLLHNGREDENQHCQGKIFAVSGPGGEAEFTERDFSQKVLKKPEGAKMAAIEASCQRPEEHGHPDHSPPCQLLIRTNPPGKVLVPVSRDDGKHRDPPACPFWCA